jgi:hypothetical protein
MRHPVIDLLEVAEAENKTGEVTVALFAGVATFTLTHADANIGSEIMHTIIRGFNRITRLLLKKGPRAAAGDLFRGQLRIRPGIAFWDLGYGCRGRNRMGRTTQYRETF